jgi:hypothetical protein
MRKTAFQACFKVLKEEKTEEFVKTASFQLLRGT